MPTRPFKENGPIPGCPDAFMFKVSDFLQNFRFFWGSLLLPTELPLPFLPQGAAEECLFIKRFPGDSRKADGITKNSLFTMEISPSSQIFLKFRIEIMGILKILCVYKLFPLSPLLLAKGYCYEAKTQYNKIFKVYIPFRMNQEEKYPLGSKWHPRNNLITQPCGDKWAFW